MLSWDEVDWSLLKSLRERFLSDSPARGGDYWTSERELEHYELAFAPRIGWKWDAVLADARARGWRPPEGATVFDWGCGTGIATRRLVAAFPEAKLARAWCWDRSARARAFAAECIGA